LVKVPIRNAWIVVAVIANEGRAGKAVIKVMAELIAQVILEFWWRPLAPMALESRSRTVHAFFDTNSTPTPPHSPKSLPVAFARSDVFKEVAVSDCLMMNGTISGLGVGSLVRAETLA